MFRDESGFTLTELLVAIVIMTVGLLGLLQAVNLALFHNMNSQMRNEASMVADEQLAKELAKPFDAVSATAKAFPPESRRVAAGFKNFSVVRSGVSFSNSKQVNFMVIWRHKGVRNIHETSSVVSKSTP